MTSSREAILDLYARLAPRLVIILARRVRIPPDLAQDAVHDVFLSVLESSRAADRLLGLDPESAFRYLFVASYRRALRDLERQQRAERRPEELLAAATTQDSPELELSRTEIAKVISAELTHLDPPYREVLELPLLDRKSFREIAQELNRPTNTVYQQVHRGFQRLRSAVNRFKNLENP